MRSILCLQGELPVIAIASDGDKFVRIIHDDGTIDFEKASRLISPATREYDIKFSRKLLKKLPIDNNFWARV